MEKKEGLSVALCLLTWNEIDGCKKDIPKIDMEMFDQVYAVDGGSSDGTIEYIKDQGIDVLVQPTKGYNSAYLYSYFPLKRKSFKAVQVAGQEGIEPPTYGFGDQRSAN